MLNVTRDKTGTLRAETHGHVPIIYENHAQDARVRQVDVAPTLSAKAGMGGNNLPIVMESIPEKSFCIAGNTIDRQIQNGGNGKGVLEEISYTLNTVDRHAVAQPSEQMSDTGGQIAYYSSKASFHTLFLKEKANTLVATDWKDAPTVTIIREEQRAAEDK